MRQAAHVGTIRICGIRHCVSESHVIVHGFVSLKAGRHLLQSVGYFPLAIHPLYPYISLAHPTAPCPSCYVCTYVFISALVLCRALQLAFPIALPVFLQPIFPVTDAIPNDPAALLPFHAAPSASLVVHSRMTYCFLLAQSHSYGRSCSATNLQTPVDWKFQNRCFHSLCPSAALF